MRTTFLMLATAAALALPAGVQAAAQSLLSDTVVADTRAQLSKNYELKGDIARARNQYGSAVNWYLLAVRYNDHDVALFNKLGIAEMKVGEMEQARHDFGQAVKIEPSNVDALNNLGVALKDLGRHSNRNRRHVKGQLPFGYGK